jgi:hypothetical protein
MSRRPSAEEAYANVVDVCLRMIADNVNPGHQAAVRYGFKGRHMTFYKMRKLSIDRGDLDAARCEELRKASWKNQCAPGEAADPDWSLLHKPIEDIEVPGSRPPEVAWTRGENTRCNPKTKVPTTRRGVIAIERSIAKWAREKGHQFGGRNELQGVA